MRKKQGEGEEERESEKDFFLLCLEPNVKKELFSVFESFVPENTEVGL